AATALLLAGTGLCRGYRKAADLLPSGIAGEALVLNGYVDQIQGHAQLRGKTHTIADRRPGGKPRPAASPRRRGLGGVPRRGAQAGSEEGTHLAQNLIGTGPVAVLGLTQGLERLHAGKGEGGAAEHEMYPPEQHVHRQLRRTAQYQ